MTFFDRSIALFPRRALTRDQVLQQLAEALQEQGLVKETYLPQVIQRELVYPTGLQFADAGVAIPHTDHIHVNQSQIAFMKLAEPVKFIQMGTADQPVMVQLIFMLALRAPEQQIDMLAKLIETLQTPGLVAELLAVGSESDYRSIIQRAGLQ